ncbi:MAG: DUF418 domain-containing protein [Saprospiraceae bacterium]|nr:DUF418 domain-containing protein [Saprospiraceae bacterium]
MSEIKPTTGSERIQVLDALRGFALFGILFANLYSFIGYNTYTPAEIIVLPILDRAVLFFIDWFVEGKFYGIFSILFGVGFALQAERFSAASVNFRAFWYRRMLVLCCIGLLHMYLIWNGDILTLYSLLGMLLPLFVFRSDRTLLRWVVVLLFIPLVIHLVTYLTPDAPFWGSLRRISTGLKAQWGFADLSLLEMRTSDSALEVCAVNVLYAIPRAMSYLLSGRYFQVLGLFLIGILLARHWLPKIKNNEVRVPSSAIWIGGIGLITSFAYAVIKGMIGTPYALTEIGLLQAVVYHVGSTSLALGIAMLFLVFWASGRAERVFQNLALLGRMALTNYIFQNVTAVLLFFGYGLALMRKVPFSYLPFFAFGILTVQWLFSRAWLKRFKQGPLEYVWRRLSYGSSRTKG